MNKTRSSTESLLRNVSSLGIHSLFLTVDAPCAGKREADERVKSADAESLNTPMAGAGTHNDKTGGGLARMMGGYIDDRLSWHDLKWLRGVWKGRIVLKGIMGAKDAKRAVEEGVNGIVLRYIFNYLIHPIHHHMLSLRFLP